jgi:hypothetical protein
MIMNSEKMMFLIEIVINDRYYEISKSKLQKSVPSDISTLIYCQSIY